ncbi:hypothetical protein ONK96_003719 [Salmonella enterica]|nr:hypothetical protein [Salmonella enterica]
MTTFTNSKLTDEYVSNATLIRLILWADQHNSHYVAAALRELQERRKADSVPVEINDDMAYAFHHALSDSSPGADEVEEIKTGLRAAFSNVTAQPAPVVPDDGREKFEALVRFHAGDKNHETLLLRANEGMNYQDPNVDLAWIFWKSSREHI